MEASSTGSVDRSASECLCWPLIGRETIGTFNTFSFTDLLFQPCKSCSSIFIHYILDCFSELIMGFCSASSCDSACVSELRLSVITLRHGVWPRLSAALRWRWSTANRRSPTPPHPHFLFSSPTSYAILFMSFNLFLHKLCIFSRAVWLVTCCLLKWHVDFATDENVYSNGIRPFLPPSCLPSLPASILSTNSISTPSFLSCRSLLWYHLDVKRFGCLNESWDFPTIVLTIKDTKMLKGTLHHIKVSFRWLIVVHYKK